MNSLAARAADVHTNSRNFAALWSLLSPVSKCCPLDIFFYFSNLSDPGFERRALFPSSSNSRHIAMTPSCIVYISRRSSQLSVQPPRTRTHCPAKPRELMRRKHRPGPLTSQSSRRARRPRTHEREKLLGRGPHRLFYAKNPGDIHSENTAAKCPYSYRPYIFEAPAKYSLLLCCCIQCCREWPPSQWPPPAGTRRG